MSRRRVVEIVLDALVVNVLRDMRCVWCREEVLALDIRRPVLLGVCAGEEAHSGSVVCRWDAAQFGRAQAERYTSSEYS